MPDRKTSERLTNKMIPVNRPLVTERDKEEVNKALEETWLSGDTTPVKNLEASLKKTLGTENAIAVSNGSVALDICTEALEINEGDECVVPTFTIISTVANLARKRAKIRLIDADPVTWSMDAQETIFSMSENTKLVVPVHIYGLSVDMDPIIEKSLVTGTHILEDAAEALGVTYKGKACGTFGILGTFSFFANKVVTGGEGGAIITNDYLLAEKIRKLKNLNHSDEERFVHKELGWNARLPGLSAALINSQLQRLEELVKTKKSKAQVYLDGLMGHPWFDFQPASTQHSENAFWVFGILLNEQSPFNAKELQNILRERGVDTRRFFCPMHLQPVFSNLFSGSKGAFPVAEQLWLKGLYLPSGIGTTDNEISQVIETLWELIK